MPIRKCQSFQWSVCSLLMAGAAQAAVYPLPPPGEDMVGVQGWASVKTDDSLATIAFRYGLGFRQLIQANPDTPPWKPDPNKLVALPTALLLPPGPREGIVVNVSEMRLYYYPAGGTRVFVYPIAVGRLDWRTPLGSTRVRAKERNPVWRPTASIRAEHAELNDPLPEVVPAGPDNPLGDYALRLGFADVLIHGTNKPLGGIGMPVTHGCVRLYPQDIQSLFQQVPVGTRVTFMDEPYKLGRHNGHWYVESHPPLMEDPQAVMPKEEVAPALQKVKASPGADARGIVWTRVQAAITQSTGVPVPVENLPAAQQVHVSRPPNTPPGVFGGILGRITSGWPSRTACSDHC